MTRVIYVGMLMGVLLLLAVAPVEAHPGRTAGDGCHYCRTNCSRWGEVAGARHCHGGGVAPKREAVIPRATLQPVASVRARVTATKRPGPTVQGVVDKPVSSELVESEEAVSDSGGSVFVWLVGLLLAGAGGWWLKSRSGGSRNE